MTITALQAAKYLCKASVWRYTHLELQKMIYIAHVIHLGRYDETLISGHFEAWDYGVVHPDLYRLLLEFGADVIPQSFRAFKKCEDVINFSNEWISLETVRVSFPPRSGPHLIRFNHEHGKAWKKHYEKYHNNVIPSESMKEEFKTYAWSDEPSG